MGATRDYHIKRIRAISDKYDFCHWVLCFILIHNESRNETKGTVEIERGKQGEGSRVWLYITQYDNGNSNNNKVSLKTPLTLGGRKSSSPRPGVEGPVDSSGLIPKKYFPMGKST